MAFDIKKALCREFGRQQTQIDNIVALIDEGNTIPFIARYRKEMTGSTDDQTLREIYDRLTYLRNLESRKDEVKKSVEEQGKLTEELCAAIEEAATLAEVEDIYRPYKPKRKTRASVAREKGLQPLADIIYAQQLQQGDIYETAAAYIDAEKGVGDAEAALAGAADIIAEDIADEAVIRKQLKACITAKGLIISAAVKDEDSVYRMYYDYSEPVKSIQSHRVLALNRGEKEGFLKVSLSVDKIEALSLIFKNVMKSKSIFTSLLSSTCEDSYSRLIFPSLEREIRNALTDAANEQSIKTFSLNLKPLLMQPPVKNRVTLGFDPAYRTGCKIAVVDGTGKVLATDVIYPTPPHNKVAAAKEKLTALIEKHHVDVIAIGNGTASHESEEFVAELIKGTPLSYMVVSEAGASVYSASKLAAAEFPDYDVSLRSAVSIARRLQDPLAELVKIDPKSIGVGQYQHDMPQARLTEALDGVVEECVNAVGVDLNTASPSLLAKVSGMGAAVAKNVLKFREDNGIFTSRSGLLKVPKLGKSTFEQCAGFLRVPESENVLDNTGVHPESYAAAAKLLSLCGYNLDDVKNNGITDLPAKVKAAGAARLAQECGVGLPTLNDIVRELIKPGRDIRDELPKPLLRHDIMSIEDLHEGMELTGTVRNVVDFGAFVDIGVHQDGLVHISKLADRFIRHPSEVVKTGDIVTVWVDGVDTEKKKISLRMTNKNS